MEAALPGYNASLLAEAADAIERHKAFAQEVSDAVEGWRSGKATRKYEDFIFTKTDPLVEALNDMKDGRAGPTTESYAACLRAAIEKRGGKIVWGEDGDGIDIGYASSIAALKGTSR
jgi:pyruvate/2-oxoacid:ferredoxin oxidoreductase beta subunit